MDTQSLRDYMDRGKRGSLQAMNARERIGRLPFASLGWAPEYVSSLLRRGYPEALCCRSMTPEQITERLSLSSGLRKNGFLCYGADEDTYRAVSACVPSAMYHADAHMISLTPDVPLCQGRHALVISGSAEDYAVSEELSVTCEVMGVTVTRFYQFSEAGVDTLTACRNALRSADIVLVVSGDGASLASQIRRQTDRPVLAVPVSRTANPGGLAAMLAVAETCTEGVTLCDADNSYGAAWLAGALFA